MKTPIILIISDNKSLERRSHIIEQMIKYQLEYVFIDAIFPANYPNIDDTLLPSSARKIKGTAEYGCALSHFSAYIYIIKNNIEHAVILEDDVEISSDFAKTIPHFQSIKFDIILLGLSKLTRNEYKYYQHYIPIHKVRPLGNKFIGLREFGKRFGAVSYAISFDGAKKMIKATSSAHVVADNWTYFESHFGIVVEEIRPLIAFECWDKFGSTIDVDRGNRQLSILYHRNRKRSLGYTIFRSIKGRIQLLSIRMGIKKSSVD